MLRWTFAERRNVRKVTEGPTKLLHQKMKSLLKRRDAHNTFTNTTQEEGAVVRCIQRENLRQLKKKQKTKN